MGSHSVPLVGKQECMFLKCTQVTGGPAEQVFCNICRFCPGLG